VAAGLAKKFACPRFPPEPFAIFTTQTRGREEPTFWNRMERLSSAISKIAENVAKRLKRCMTRRGHFSDHVLAHSKEERRPAMQRFATKCNLFRKKSGKRYKTLNNFARQTRPPRTAMQRVKRIETFSRFPARSSRT
jgi:hypothetical protein